MPTSSSSGINHLRSQIKHSGIPGSPRKLAQLTSDQCNLGPTRTLTEPFESAWKRENSVVCTDKNNQPRPLTWEQTRQIDFHRKKMVHANPRSGKNTTLPTDQLRSRIAANRNRPMSPNHVSNYSPRSVEKVTLNAASGQRETIAPVKVQMQRHVAANGSKDIRKKPPNFQTLNRTDHPRIPGRHKKTRALFSDVSTYVPENYQPFQRESERQREQNFMFSEAFTRHQKAAEVMLNLQKGITPQELLRQKSLSTQKCELNHQNSVNTGSVQKAHIHQKTSDPKSHSKINQTFLNAPNQDRFHRVVNVSEKHKKQEYTSEPEDKKTLPQVRHHKVERVGGREKSASSPNLLPKRHNTSKRKGVKKSYSESSTNTPLSSEFIDDGFVPSRKVSTRDALKWQDHLAVCRKEDLKQWCPLGERAYHVNKYLIKKVRDSKCSPETSFQPDNLEVRNRQNAYSSKSFERNSPPQKSPSKSPRHSKATHINREPHHRISRAPNNRDRVAHLEACSSDFSYSPTSTVKRLICKTISQQKLEHEIVSSPNNFVAPDDWVRIDRISTYSNEHRQLWFPTSNAARHKAACDREAVHSNLHQKGSPSSKVQRENDRLDTSRNECRRTRETKHCANCHRKVAHGSASNEKNLTRIEPSKRREHSTSHSNEDLQMRSRGATPTHLRCEKIYQENSQQDATSSKLLLQFPRSVGKDKKLDEDTYIYYPTNEKCHSRKDVHNVRCDKHYPDPPQLDNKNEKIGTYYKSEDRHKPTVLRHSKSGTFDSRTSESESVVCKKHSICSLSHEVHENTDICKNKNHKLSPKSCCKTKAVSQHRKSKYDVTSVQNYTEADMIPFISHSNECVHKQYHRSPSSGDSQHRKGKRDSPNNIRKCSYTPQGVHENQILNDLCTRPLKHVLEERKTLHNTRSPEMELETRKKKCLSRSRSEDGQNLSPASKLHSHTCLQHSTAIPNLQHNLNIQDDLEIRGYFENKKDKNKLTTRNPNNIILRPDETMHDQPSLKLMQSESRKADVDLYRNKNPQGGSRALSILHLTKPAYNNRRSPVEGLKRCESLEDFSSDDQQTKHVCARYAKSGTCKKMTHNAMSSTLKIKPPTKAQKIEDDLVITSYSGEDIKSHHLTKRLSNGNFHPRNVGQEPKIPERRATSVETAVMHYRNSFYRNRDATRTQPSIYKSQSEDECLTEKRVLSSRSHEKEITPIPVVENRNPRVVCGEEKSRRCPLSSSSDRSFYFRQAMQIVTSLKNKEVLKDHIDGTSQQRRWVALSPRTNQQQHIKQTWPVEKNREKSAGIQFFSDLTDEDENNGCINCVVGKRSPSPLKPVCQDENVTRNSAKKSKSSRKFQQEAPAMTFPVHLVRRLGRAMRCLVGDSASDSAALHGRRSAASKKNLRHQPRAPRTPNHLSRRLGRTMRAFMSSHGQSSHGQSSP